MANRILLGTLVAAVVAGSGALAQGKDQLARELGVDAGDYTTIELVQLKCRLEAADTDAERDRLLQEVKGVGGPVGEQPSGNKAQIAANLGVDPSDYTTEELIWLRTFVESNDCSTSEALDVMASGEQIGEPAAAAKAQLASALGVDPTSHTLDELVSMHFEQSAEHSN